MQTNTDILKQWQSERTLIFVHGGWLKRKILHLFTMSTLLCGQCSIFGGRGRWLGMGQGGKVTMVHMTLASIQSNVQNVMLFCKKRFSDFKNKFSEPIFGGHFF